MFVNLSHLYIYSPQSINNIQNGFVHVSEHIPLIDLLNAGCQETRHTSRRGTKCGSIGQSCFAQPASAYGRWRLPAMANHVATLCLQAHVWVVFADKCTRF